MYSEYIKPIIEKINEKEEELKEIENKLKTPDNEAGKLFENRTRLKNEIVELKKQLINLENLKPMLDKDIDININDVEFKNSMKDNNANKEITTIDDIALIHKTRFIPEKGIIQTVRDSNAVIKEKIMINGKEYDIEYSDGRNTVHFCMNGPVGDHIYGSWADTSYAIIVPFNKVSKDNLLVTESQDTYFLNSVALPEGSIIVCPKNDKEKVKQLNPNIKVIGYDENVKLNDAVESILMYSGYKIKQIGSHEWNNYNDKDYKDRSNLQKIKEENNLVDKDVSHVDSRNIVDTQLYSMSQRIIAISKVVIDNNLFDESGDLTHLLSGLGYYGQGIVTRTQIKEFFSQFVRDVLSSNLYVNLEIFDRDLAHLYELIMKKPGTGENNENLDGNSVLPEIQDYLISCLISYEALKRMAQQEENTESTEYQPK